MASPPETPPPVTKSCWTPLMEAVSGKKAQATGAILGTVIAALSATAIAETNLVVMGAVAAGIAEASLAIYSLRRRASALKIIQNSLDFLCA